METSDPFRKQFRPMTDAEKSMGDMITVTASDLYALIDATGPSRESAVAKTKLEEAVMWAVKGITR